MADEKSGIAIAGLGSVGSRHASNVASLGLDVYAVRSRESVTKVDSIIKKVYPDIGALPRKLIKGLIICTPTSMHLGMAKQAVEAGLPVLIEKPISHNYNGVQELGQLIAKTDVPVMVGFNFRYHPQIRKIKKLLTEKALGKIYYSRLWWADDVSSWYPEGAYAKNYTSSKQLGGGALLTICHEVDFAMWFFGRAQQVYGTLLNLSNLEMRDVEDYFSGMIMFQEGNHCFVHVDFITPIPRRGMIIAGENGSVAWDYFSGKLAVEIKGEKPFQEDIGPITPEFKNETYISELKDFISLAEGSIENPMPYDSGEYVQFIIEKFKKSSILGEPVEIQEG